MVWIFAFSGMVVLISAPPFFCIDQIAAHDPCIIRKPSTVPLLGKSSNSCVHWTLASARTW